MRDMRRLAWTLTAVIGLALLTAVVVYVIRVGLDDADKLASVIGAVFGAASLGLGVIQLIRGNANTLPAPASAQFTNTGNTIGQMIQADTINGPIDMRRDG